MPDITEILDQFIVQAQTDSLVVKHYPREHVDLRMKVSFGQGVPARVPWIAIIAPEMQVHHGFYPVYLYFKALNKLILAYGISETIEFHMTWPAEVTDNRSTITDYLTTEVPRYGDSYVFKAYVPEIAGNQVNYLDDESGKRLSPDDLDRELKQLINDYKKFVSIEIQDEDGLLHHGLFHLESHLEDFIINNWDQTELGKRYDLIYEEGELMSQQFMTDIGPIDILVKNKQTGNHVVIELKRGQTSDQTVGQLTRYMGWVKEKLNDEGVTGIIIAGQFDERLRLAISVVPNTEIFLYAIDFSLERQQ